MQFAEKECWELENTEKERFGLENRRKGSQS
jgi:hypothetical protein